MTDGGEMASASEGNVNPCNIWVPDAVAYRLAMFVRSGGTLSTRCNDSYFEIVRSALKASNIESRARSRLCL